MRPDALPKPNNNANSTLVLYALLYSGTQVLSIDKLKSLIGIFDFGVINLRQFRLQSKEAWQFATPLFVGEVVSGW